MPSSKRKHNESFKAYKKRMKSTPKFNMRRRGTVLWPGGLGTATASSIDGINVLTNGTQTVRA